MVRFATGQIPAAREHVERAVEPFSAGPSRNPGAFFRQMAQAASNVLVAILVILGHPSTALSRGHELLAAARQNSDPLSTAIALFGDGMHHLLLRDTRMLAERADELLSIATEHEMAVYLVMATFFRGWAMAVAGRGDEGIPEMRRSISDPVLAEHPAIAQSVTLLAEICGKNGRAEEGLDLVAEGLRTADRTGIRVAEAELRRVKGELLLMHNPSDEREAERCLRTAIDVARRQGARLFELRATVSLACLLKSQEKIEEARTMLVEIYNWFSEGFDTADLKDAKALLDELNK
jgi:predicted ATPase